VKNIVVTHATAEVPGMTLEQLKQAVAMGAQHFILSSDPGQNGTPTHPGRMEMMINGM
jgi:hypothetical protein